MGYKGLKYRYSFNGMEKDDEVKGANNSLDFGARIYDNRIGRWLARDPLERKYPGLSPYNFSANSVLFYVDPDGEDLIVLFYVKGHKSKEDDIMFRAAAITRKRNLMKSESYNSKKDKVIIIGIESLSEIDHKMQKAINKYSQKYGETTEVGVWSHSGQDGPIGTKPANKEDALYKEGDVYIPRNEKQGGAVLDKRNSDSKQLSLEAWGEINFNWSESEPTNFTAYGCNSANSKGRNNSFTTNLSQLNNFENVVVTGQSTSSFPSLYTDIRQTNPERSGIFSTDGDKTVGFAKGDTYMVGGNAGEGFEATYGDGIKANPMISSRNGNEIDKNVIQSGKKKN